MAKKPGPTDPEGNLRRRSERHEGRPLTLHGFRLDHESAAALKRLQEIYCDPVNPADRVNTSAIFRRALAVYQHYALNPDVRADEFMRLRNGSILPVRRNRRRNPGTESRKYWHFGLAQVDKIMR